VEKLKRECKKKNDEIKNIKKKLKEMSTNRIHHHQQHFRTSSGEGVSSFFKVKDSVLVSLYGYLKM
jgi:flagellar biosynthesis chaperone FliJ